MSAELPDDPDAQDKRAGFGAGMWPGAPFNRLPPECPVIPLGISGKFSFFMDTNRQIRSVKTSEWGKKEVTDLFALTPNYVYWAWPRFDAKAAARGEVKINGIQADEAQACLVKAAAARGLFDPRERVRGRGAWRTAAGDLVWHSGRRLFMIRSGKLVSSVPGEIDNQFYSAEPPILEPWRERVPLGDSPAHHLLAMLRTWNWQRPVDPLLYLGGLGVGFMGGAIKHRPVMFVTGDRRVGKSTLQELYKLVLDSAALSLANVTEASLRQLVGQSALPVAVDELEADVDDRAERKVIELARLAYSGTQMARGGADHQATTFRARSAFFFSSINIPPLTTADKSRMAVLNLGVIDPGHEAPPDFTIASDVVGRQLLRQLMDGWPDLQRHIDNWNRALRGAGLDGRATNTYGTLLAHAHLLLGDEAMEEAGLPVTDDRRLGEVVARFTSSERAEQTDNWRQCLELLFDCAIDLYRGGEKPTIGGELEYLMAGEHDVKAGRERLALAGLGLMPPGRVRTPSGELNTGYLLAVPLASKQLNEMFQGSVFRSGVWTGALRQAPPNVVLRPDGEMTWQVKINNKNAKCTLVDLAAYDELTKEGDEDDT